MKDYIKIARPDHWIKNLFIFPGTLFALLLVGWKGSYGYLVIITHDNGVQTYYAHNSSLLVSAGDKVYQGQAIAKAGSTGNSTGVHCHFEVRVGGRAVNPLNYLS